MQTIQFKVDDNYVNVVLTLLDNLKKDMVKDLTVINNDVPKTDEQMKLDQVKGILKNKIPDPMAYQRALRSEWERE